VSNAPSKPVSFSRPKVGYFSNRPRIYNETLRTANTKVSLFGLCYNSGGFLKSSRFEILNLKLYLKYYVRGKRDKLVPLMTEFNCVNL